MKCYFNQQLYLLLYLLTIFDTIRCCRYQKYGAIALKPYVRNIRPVKKEGDPIFDSSCLVFGILRGSILRLGDQTERWAKGNFWAKIGPKIPKVGQNSYLANC